MIARLHADAFGRLSDPIDFDPMNFCFNQPYEYGDLSPADIREEFAGLCFEHGQDPQTVLDSLAAYLPADTLAEFLDDLAMGRI
jgi:hypothetical protein